MGNVERTPETDHRLLTEMLGPSVSQDTCTALLNAFGDLENMVHADSVRAAAVLRSMPQSAQTVALQQLLVGHISAMVPPRLAITSAVDVAPRLQAKIGGRRTETFVVLFLDASNHVLSEEVLWSGTIDAVPVYPREVVRRALALDASALILAHNHPSQIVMPSNPDWIITSNIIKAASLFNIAVQDHLVIGRTVYHSMRFHSQNELWPS